MGKKLFYTNLITNTDSEILTTSGENILVSSLAVDTNIYKYAKILSNYLPNGEQWIAKTLSDSNLHRFIISLGYEFSRMGDLIEWFKKELNILTTESLIEYWEKQLGIPDSIFEVKGKTIAQRRLNLKIKMLMNGAEKTSDWEYIASLLGFTVTVLPFNSYQSPPYPVPFTPYSDLQGAYTTVVIGQNLIPEYPPLDVPFTPSNGEVSFLYKVFQFLKPADSRVLFVDSIDGSQYYE